MAYSYDKVLAPVSQADLHLASVISLHVHGKLTLLLLSKQFAVDVSPRELTSRSAQEAGLRNEYIPILLMVMLFWWWSLCLLNVAKLGGALVVGAHPSRIGRRRGIVVSASDCEPAEGDVVLYRNDPESDEELSFGVVVADMGCTQWLQPLISKDVVAESNEQLVLFEEGVDDVMVQGGCVAVVDAMWGQLPIPSLGGGTGYNSPPVSSWTVKAADLPLPLSEIEIKVFSLQEKKMQQRHVVFLTCFVSLAHGFVAYPPNQRSAMRRFVFSGIVEEMGTVVSVSQSEEMVLWDGSTGEGHEMTIRGKVALLDAYIGCSIAVDGVCLTATALGADDFKLGISPETLRRTTLGERRVGDLVNLERSLRAEDRNSGHYVQGHVDGTGTVVEKWVEGDSLWMRLAPPPELLRFIVEKGYIAVDGTSLTVCDVDSTSFTLMLIEHTQKCIVLPTKDVGDPVNLEVDVMAKYSQRALGDIARLENRIESLERRLKDLETSEAGTDYTGLD